MLGGKREARPAAATSETAGNSILPHFLDKGRMRLSSFLERVDRIWKPEDVRTLAFSGRTTASSSVYRLPRND